MLLIPALIVAQAAAADLTGLWSATLRFGPDARGTLLVMRTPDGWRADIAGYNGLARVDENDGAAQHAALLHHVTFS
ncbi:MAG: hypothetical protein ACREMI_10795, partial [Gemmatimonadales bacterium]